MPGVRFFLFGSMCAVLACLPGCGTAVPVGPAQAQKPAAPAQTAQAPAAAAAVAANAQVAAAPAAATTAAAATAQAAAAPAAGETCTAKPYAKRRYARLAKRMYLDPDLNRSMPVEYLTDESKPTRTEIADLYRLHAEMQACRKILLDGASDVHPLILTALIESFSENDRVWAQAASGKLTWGQFNEARERLALQATVKMTEVEGQIDGRLQSREQFETQQRERATAAMQQWASQQQQLYQHQRMADVTSPPRTINCNYAGNAANCTSVGAP